MDNVAKAPYYNSPDGKVYGTFKPEADPLGFAVAVFDHPIHMEIGVEGLMYDQVGKDLPLPTRVCKGRAKARASPKAAPATAPHAAQGPTAGSPQPACEERTTRTAYQVFLGRVRAGTFDLQGKKASDVWNNMDSTEKAQFKLPEPAVKLKVTTAKSSCDASTKARAGRAVYRCKKCKQQLAGRVFHGTDGVRGVGCCLDTLWVATRVCWIVLDTPCN